MGMCEGAGEPLRAVGGIPPLILGRPGEPLGLLGSPTGAEFGGTCGEPVRPGGNLFCSMEGEPFIGEPAERGGGGIGDDENEFPRMRGSAEILGGGRENGSDKFVGDPALSPADRASGLDLGWNPAVPDGPGELVLTRRRSAADPPDRCCCGGGPPPRCGAEGGGGFPPGDGTRPCSRGGSNLFIPSGETDGLGSVGGVDGAVQVCSPSSARGTGW